MLSFPFSLALLPLAVMAVPTWLCVLIWFGSPRLSEFVQTHLLGLHTLAIPRREAGATCVELDDILIANLLATVRALGLDALFVRLLQEHIPASSPLTAPQHRKGTAQGAAQDRELTSTAGGNLRARQRRAH